MYFLDQGVRHPVGERWSSLYLNRTVAVPDPYLFQYRIGRILNIPNYILVKEADHPAIFYIEAGKKDGLWVSMLFNFINLKEKTY